MSELNTESNSQLINIGDRLRKLREARGLSIRSLSQKCGLAVNTLSLIENGKTSPSINTLTKITKSLGIPITAFFDASITKGDIGFIKKRTALRNNYDYGEVIDLGSQKTTHPILPFLLTIDPQSNMGNGLITHPGYEFVYCLTGKLEYVINSESFHLEFGDSLLFDASLPHNWQNNTDEAARLLMILYPLISSESILKNQFPDTS